ncbi:MAG: alpha/beta hydrolase [Solobacterium sp.]|nr:alpha/beta hydrolase [Solobacterium sp.]
MPRKSTAGEKILKAALLGTSAYGAACGITFMRIFDVEKSWFREKYGTAGKTDDEWLQKAEIKDVYTDSYDGLKLHAMVIEHHPESDRWLIPLHGYAADGRAIVRILKDADEQGYNLLVPDLRAHGFSEGRWTGFGWPEHYDLLGWIGWLCAQRPESRIALYGVSLGAAAVMNTVGERLPANVKCAVEDCGFVEIKEILASNLKAVMNFKVDFLMPGIDFFVKQILHFSMYDVSTRRQLRNAQVPVLFLHGTEDRLVHSGNAYDCYYACAGKRKLHIVQGAGHAAAWLDDECRQNVFAFLDECFKQTV